MHAVSAQIQYEESSRSLEFWLKSNIKFWDTPALCFDTLTYTQLAHWLDIMPGAVISASLKTSGFRVTPKLAGSSLTAMTWRVFSASALHKSNCHFFAPIGFKRNFWSTDIADEEDM